MSTESKFLIGIGIVTLLLIGAGIFFLGKKSQNTTTQSIDQTALIADGRHTQGNPDAPVKIVEFADFQCPACGIAHPILKKVIAENSDKVYFVYRHYPLSVHKNAKKAAQACEAAGTQGKFWEMHNLIFEKQGEWSEKDNASEIFEKYAGELGLNVDEFKNNLYSNDKFIERDYAEGNRFGVSSTPTFFINGQKYPGVIQESQLLEIINNTK